MREFLEAGFVVVQSHSFDHRVGGKYEGTDAAVTVESLLRLSMGQEQSLLGSGTGESGLQSAQHDGFRIVSSAANTGGGDVASDPAVRAVNALPLPYPVLPPPPVRDDVTSALSGAQMIHELRSAFGSMLPPSVVGTMESQGNAAEAANEATAAGATDLADDTLPSSRASVSDATSNTGALPGSDDQTDVRASGGASTLETHPVADAAAHGASGGSDEAAALRTQQRWARAMLDLSAVAKAVDEAGGGDALVEVLATQEYLLQRMRDARATAERVQMAMAATEKEASRTRKALESLERLRMAAADVQDGLEAGVATANILGASHFADDDEMRSFKDYLLAHPPDYGDDPAP